MTEERFIIADYPTDIIDNRSGKKYPCSSYGTHMEIICDLLNQLNDENERLKQDKKRLIGFLHRYKGVDVEEVDEEVLSKEYLDEWGELYYSER